MGVLDGKVAVITGSSCGFELEIDTSMDITSIAPYKMLLKSSCKKRDSFRLSIQRAKQRYFSALSFRGSIPG